MSESASVFEILKVPEKVVRLMPIRIVLRIPPGGFGTEGMIENSFSMDWSKNRVRVWWSSKHATSNLGGTDIVVNGIEDAEHNAEKLGGVVFDPMSDQCPVRIDWDAWMNPANKFESRNAPFEVKQI